MHLPLRLRVPLAATMNPFERVEIIKKFMKKAANCTPEVRYELAFCQKYARETRKRLDRRHELELERIEKARVPGSREAGLLLDFYMRGTAPPAVELPRVEEDPASLHDGWFDADEHAESEDTGIEGSEEFEG